MVSVIRPELCIRCKGRLWCGLSKCPILEARRRVKEVRLSTELSGYSPPSFLVGWSGYPDVNVTPLVTQEDPRRADNPSLWVREGLGIDDILDLRMTLGGGSRRVNVRRDVEEIVREIAMSRSPVAADLFFEKPPRPSVSFSNVFPPIGFRGPLKDMELAENPRVDRRVERFYYDEVKVRDAVLYLYQRGYDVYELSRYLSAGILGVKKRMVPTRWAITAVDSMISEELLRELRGYPSVEEVLLFHSHLYDNHFFIFFIPGAWAFELVEAWAPKSFWSRGSFVILSDGEMGRSRREYASNVGGSYYASKIAVLEKLVEMRRRASVLILREVHEGYYAPLGVWQVRENVRNALKGKPLRFGSLREALEHARSLGMRVPVSQWKRHSLLLKGVQKTLF
ncbi:MAG: hypothetical protein GXO00_00580 [Candidatus Diapherotrites archaeon]|nr:hypothetical protein [Candidatus Diapherotrites archaeon]